jgi:hypothetical protein
VIKILLKRKWLYGKKIVVITNNMHPVVGSENISPGHSTILGLLKVVTQEHPSVFSFCVDVSFSDRIDSTLITKLHDEIINNTSDRVIALRNNQRWLQVYDRIRVLKKKKDKETLMKRLVKGGVYLITGGLGNVGHIVANYLIKNANAKLILTGRTELPQKEDWNDVLSKPGLDYRIRDKILKLKDLNSSGGDIVYYKGNVSNLTEMKHII